MGWWYGVGWECDWEIESKAEKARESWEEAEKEWPGIQDGIFK